MIDPKWYVIAAALVAFAILISFDLTFGLIAGGILLTIIAIRISIGIWLASDRGEPDAERPELVNRFQRLTQNREKAYVKELGAQNGADTGEQT